MTQRITPSARSLEILARIQLRCGLPTLQSALDTLAALKGEQLLAQLEAISNTDLATFCELISEATESANPHQEAIMAYEVVDGQGNVVSRHDEANDAATEASDRQDAGDPNSRVRHENPNS